MTDAHPTEEQQVDLDQMEVFIASELEPDQYQRVKPMITEIRRLRRELTEEKRRSFQDCRITYKGFNYGVGSQWGIDSLRRAIEGNGHG